jgi:heat shock factor-binding protein 1
MQQLLQQLQDKFQSTSGQIFTRIDETGRSLDDLEKTVADLMTEAGIDQ